MSPTDMARREAVYDAVRRLPKTIAVYSKHAAAVLALVLAEDSAMYHAIAEDTWDGVRQNWPDLGPVNFEEPTDER